MAEIRKLIVATEADEIRLGTFLRLLAATGMRRDEACALRWAEVDPVPVSFAPVRLASLNPTAFMLAPVKDAAVVKSKGLSGPKSPPLRSAESVVAPGKKWPPAATSADCCWG